MYYKISLSAGLESLEKTFEARFAYPNIYEPEAWINGLEERQVPMIRQGSRGSILPAIWGLMPEGSKEEWSVLQDQVNTLNLGMADLETTPWLEGVLEQRRSAILATGFLTHGIQDGELRPFHIHLPGETPFPVAAVYTELEDGFLTCALLTTGITQELAHFQQLGRRMPLTLSPRQLDVWLATSTPYEQVLGIFKNPWTEPLQSNPISRARFQSGKGPGDFVHRMEAI